MKITTTAMSIFAAAGLLSGSWVFAGDGQHKEHHKAAEHKAAAVEETAKDVKVQTTCPVMGGKINKDLYVDAEGKRIYVCCKGCIGAVKKNPEKYIEKLEEQGVTLASVDEEGNVKYECPMTKKCPKKSEGECHMKGKAKGECPMKAKADCPATKDCPKDKCPVGEKEEGHKEHHEEKAE